MDEEKKKKNDKPRRPRVVLLKDLASEETFDDVTGGSVSRKLVFGARVLEKPSDGLGTSRP